MRLGRFARLFIGDFDADDMAGIDIDPGIVAVSQASELPGRFLALTGATLPFRDGEIKLATAYSVFTHLPRAQFEHWLAELGRVLAPGALLAFRTEPRRFLSFIEEIQPGTERAPFPRISCSSRRSSLSA